MKKSSAIINGTLKLLRVKIFGEFKINEKAASPRGASRNNLGIFIGSIENFGVIIKLTPPSVAITRN